MHTIAAVEMQDFALQHLYAQLEFGEPQANVVDTRAVTAKAMQEHLGLAKVTLAPTAAEVVSDDGRNKYRIGIAQTYVSLMDFDDLADAKDRTRKFFEMAMSYLHEPGVAASNLQTYDIAPVDSFDELRDRLVEKLGGGAMSGLSSAVGMAVSDVGWVFEFEEAGKAMHVQLGPMGNDQLAGMLSSDGGVQDYPESVLFLGIGTALRPERPPKDAVQWWCSALDDHRRAAERMGDWIKEMIT